jgi:arylsulfatase A-like enzyme
VHEPAEVPPEYTYPYNTTIPDRQRRTFAGMMAALDMAIGNVTAALRTKGMLDNLLLVFTADNVRWLLWAIFSLVVFQLLIRNGIFSPGRPHLRCQPTLGE